MGSVSVGRRILQKELNRSKFKQLLITLLYKVTCFICIIINRLDHNFLNPDKGCSTSSCSVMGIGTPTDGALPVFLLRGSTQKMCLQTYTFYK
jgi:hypothetical protein